MSQTNSFQKSNNPNYVYFDLQQTNAYNNTETDPATEPAQLRFVETRDSPIVPSSGDYAMSVLRFQVDTYGLPVLVIEPKIQTPFNFQETIHKVGIRIKGVNLPNITAGAGSLTTLGALNNYTTYSSVFWNPEDPSLQPPIATGALTGKNTVVYPYYHCHSYDRFINFLNVAIKNTYIDMITYLWNNLVPAGAARVSYGDGFVNAFIKAFPTPPYFSWSNFSADLIANQLFGVTNAEFNVNYETPGISWTTVGPSNIGLTGNPRPFNFELLLSASLYTLFNTLPAREITINNEKFFQIEFNYPQTFTTTSDLLVPKMNPYPFDSIYYNAVSRSYTIPTGPATGTFSYPYSNKFFKISQEMSTIDTWSPINSIVFTSSTLPIIVNQASTRTTRNFEVPRSEVNSEFELIITDFQTNQQGFRPNVLYTPSSEYRRIDMTGNTPIQIIDIAVLWRARTGQLIPFYLPRGGSASLKILFEKKSLEQMK
jgi:hypothetical protein